MNITRTPATITHIALMLASGVSRIGTASAPKATPGRTSEATAATGPVIKSLFFIDFLLVHRSPGCGGRGVGDSGGTVNSAREAVFRRGGGIPAARFLQMARLRAQSPAHGGPPPP